MLKVNRLIASAAGGVAISICAAARADYEAPNPAYNAPASYYNAAAGTGFTLRTNLHTIISAGFHAHTYGEQRYAMGTGEGSIPGGNEFIDPNNSSNILLVYNRASILGQWDAGATWNREHVWPKFLLNLTSSQVSNSYSGVASDSFELMPANPTINSNRSDYGYGFYLNNSSPAGTYGPNDNNGTHYWYPGNADRGDVSRSIFYMATRWFDPNNSSRGTSNTNLELKNGAPTLFNFGDENSLLHWNYTDGVDNFERRRNQYIYDPTLNPTYYQGNRNPFIDHPEYVWAIFGPTSNSSQIYAGGSPASDGSSAVTVNLPRIMKNGTLGTANVLLNKTGATPTTYDLTTGGAATTAAAGVGQPFDYGSVTRTLTLGLSTSTSTTGLKTGTVTIKNTDLTSAGTGQGSADANDLITINGQVVDNRAITAAPVTGRVITGRAISLPVNLTTSGDDDHFTRVTVKGNASAADANGSFVAAGSDALFNSAASTATRSISANFSGTGARSGSMALTMQGEGLSGEIVSPSSASYNVTAVNGSEASFDSASHVDGKAIDFDYVPQFFVRSAMFSVNNLGSASDTAALDIDSVSAAGDAAVLSNTAAPTGASPIAAGSHNDYAVNVDTSAVGSFSATHTIGVSDENIPGAASGANLVLATSARVTAGDFPASGSLNLLNSEIWTPTLFSIHSGVTITKTGSGALSVSSVQTNGDNATLVLAAGDTTLHTDAGGTARNYALNLSLTNSGTFARSNSAQHLKSLSLGADTQTVFSGGESGPLYTQSLAIDPTAKLDLNDNDLVVSYGTGPSVFSAVQSLVFAGYSATPDSSKTGIISTTGQNAGNTILALFDNALVGAADWPLGSGDTIDPNSVVGKYTFFGDMDMDGRVTADDYGVLDANLGSTPAPGLAWLSGDADLDGTVTPDDYGILDANMGSGTVSSMALASTSSVPEPAVMSLVALLTPMLMRRRRR